MFECTTCQKKFEKSGALRLHRFRTHKLPVVYKCYYCNHQTNYKWNLSLHIKMHMKEVAKEKKTLVSPQNLNVCSLCNCFECSDRWDMIAHYQNTHDVQINEQMLTFSSHDEFVTWKRDTESKECSRFLMIRGAKKNRHTTVSYYRCFRDGHYVPKGSGKRKLKLKGSCKIGSVCPACIKVVENPEDGRISVTYIACHVGHTSEVGRLNLTAEEKAQIACKLSAGVPIDKILDSLRESVNSRELSRIHLTTRKDIWNLMSSLHLQNEVRHHEDDSTSVEAWLATLDGSRDFLRFYKPQSSLLVSHPELKEEDFVLIISFNSQLEMLQKFGSDCLCFYGARGTDGYAFELTTILVKDDKKQGFPCAYMISNRSDSDIMALFIGTITSLLKTPLTPQVLMSDMSEVYFNGWCAVMPHPVHWLYCTWHTDQAWRKKINSISDPTKRCATYKLLRMLAEEPDESAFKMLLEKVLNTLSKDPDLIEFGKYFSKEYAPHAERWAFCFRTYSGINTNMFVKSMHKILKYYYLDGEKVRRLDRGLSALLKFTRDKLIDRLMAGERGKLSNKLAAICDRHEKSMALNSTIIAMGDGSWTISSETKPEMYTVAKQRNVLCECTLRCEVCNICEHDYRCTCMGSMKPYICKHIHRIAMHEKTVPSDSCITEEQMSDDELLIAEHVDNVEKTLLGEHSATNQSIRGSDMQLEQVKQDVMSSFVSLLNSATTCDHVEVIKKALLPVPHAMNALEAGLIFTHVDPLQPIENVNPPT